MLGKIALEEYFDFSKSGLADAVRAMDQNQNWMEIVRSRLLEIGEKRLAGMDASGIDCRDPFTQGSRSSRHPLSRRRSTDRNTLDSLPGSIPEIYTRYLEQINLDNPSVPDFLTGTEMLDAANTLARLALGSNIIPNEFYAKPHSRRRSGRSCDPLQRLEDNGLAPFSSTIKYINVNSPLLCNGAENRVGHN